jgi:hypothetical protein
MDATAFQYWNKNEGDQRVNATIQVGKNCR